MSELWLVAVLAFASFATAGVLVARSSAGFMERYRENFLSQARLNLADMFLFVDPQALFMGNALLLVLVPALLWIVTGNLFLPVVALVLLAVLPRKIYLWLKQRRLDRIQQQLPDGLLMLASSLRAGVGFNPALETLAQDGQPPLAQELSLVLREQHMGIRTEEALEHFAQRVPIDDARLFVAAVTISREIGGNLAETLATLAETLRRKLMMEGKVKALTAQGRLQGIVMAMLPAGLVGFLVLFYPETMQPMFHTWQGWCVIALVFVLEYLGYRMCRKIMTIDI
ncbi:type II secretion system F family protein [Flavobacterium sp. MXW15]|uniref:Type II secretion system F family protein n=1 Tax=Xanthomonas chitinilytica TaxID=2989819 RepID=A0ABT3JYP0_9XANT|nr:type II secretion system F family protein [Xanthomonas sp. H13-6]MCW4454367.1 type II secretion system F family protein [Flavobacterium sp. MXW15]MCW4473329.1 type II secretion system F family protein [Xanthomonas sp. H13-6]